MKNSLVPFEFEGSNVRAIPGDNGIAWFVGMDIAALLGYSEPHKAIQKHCIYAKILKRDDLSLLGMPPRGLLIIPESDVWRLIIRSKLPKAEAIEKWVMEEVLPCIRLTGSYALQREPQPMPALPESVTCLRPALRERILYNAIQAARLTNKETLETVEELFFRFCELVSGGRAMVAPETDPEVGRWAVQALEDAPGTPGIQCNKLYAAFHSWHLRHADGSPPSLRVFGKAMKHLFGCRVSNKVYYLVRWREGYRRKAAESGV